ncbi:amino acid ABC transporter substrate-binding protein [Rhodobacteraceae bacterium CH30]|nr:amino acid ABC transporter substrate-binding protein [Rhodobacteraceae bacterium CH30]
MGRRAFLASVLSGVLTACNDSQSPLSGVFGRVAVQPLRVGINAAYAPFESLNVRGEPVGFDIDLMRLVASHMGRELVFVNLPWRRLLQSLAQRRLDVVISAVAVTPARARNFLFTRPYYRERQGLLRAQALVALPLQQIRRIGVLEYSRADDHLARLGVESGQIKAYPDAVLMQAAYHAGEVNALFGDEHVLRVLHLEATDMLSFDAAFGLDEYAIVLPMGAEDLQAQLNQSLQELEHSGALAALVRQLDI